jgi:hypothetical protein
MDDLFYFSRRNLSLDEIASLGQKLSWPGVRIYEGGLEVDLGPAKDSVSQWSVLELTHIEPAERARLEGEGVISCFCVSFHSRSTEFLRKIFQDVLREFGGWVGSDEEDFCPRFDLSNINQLV